MRFTQMKKIMTYSYLSFRLIYLCRFVVALCFISLGSGCMIELWPLCHMTSAQHHEIRQIVPDVAKKVGKGAIKEVTSGKLNRSFSFGH